MDSITELINIFKQFPGIGPKSARRMAFYLLKKNKRELYNIGKIIATAKNNLFTCSNCGNISGSDPCEICSDPLRDKNVLCIVEDLETLAAFEHAKIYNGLYHVLGEIVSPYEEKELSECTINFLLDHVKKNNPDEIIIATNPKVEGDLTYYALVETLKNSGLKINKISRLAMGLPMGSTIEFADKLTLHMALEARTDADLNL